MNIPKNYPLYESTYGQDFPIEQFYVMYFDTIPSKYTTGSFYDNCLSDKLESENYKLLSRIITTARRTSSEQIIKNIYINEDKKIIFITVKTDNKNESLLVDICYDIRSGDLMRQVPFLFTSNYLHKKIKKSNINLVKVIGGHLDAQEFDLNVGEIDIELNYGKSFTRIHDLILKKLNENKSKGIILLHGEPGTGKSSYIKYLTSVIKDKQILYIPPSMAESLSEPNFIPFLMDFKNSILIIEDAESVITDREFGGSIAGVSNILNITDGILGDCLNIQIIATFNMEKRKIDKALLRKGRLIAEHKFLPLNINDTNKLLKHLNKNYISEQEMILAEIYNIYEEIYKSEEKSQKIGFYQ